MDLVSLHRFGLASSTSPCAIFSCMCADRLHNRAVKTKCISATDAQRQFDSFLQDTANGNAAIVVKDRVHGNAVIISEDAYNSMKETLYLTCGENGRVLQRSVQDAANGKARPFSLEELDDMLK